MPQASLLVIGGDFKRAATSYVSTSGNVQAVDPQRPSVEPSLRTLEQHSLAEHDDERTLSISANGAYYLLRVRLREIGAVLLGVHSGTGWRRCSFAGKTSVR